MDPHIKLTNKGEHRSPYGSLGNAIKTLREKRQLTQEQLGKKVQRTQSAIASYESERICPSLKTLQRMAIEFNVPMELMLSHRRSMF